MFTGFQSSVHHIVYAIAKLPRFYADCHYDLLSAHVGKKIATSSASLPVQTIWQNHRCSTLEKWQWHWPGVKVTVSMKSSRLHKNGANFAGGISRLSILFDMQPSSNGSAGHCSFHSFSMIDVILTEIFRHSNCSSFFQNFPFGFPGSHKDKNNLGA